MKVKDLLEEITRCKKELGDSFLEWDIYTEQLEEGDKKMKAEDKWGKVTDGDDWEYYHCAGFWTKFPDKKIFTVNVNF